jgi:hypothetical protein
MRFNRLYPLSAALISVSALLLPLSCSRTDVITGAGGTAVTDYNPELTDLDRGFAAITLIDTAVGTAFSLPPAPDPLFGTFIKDYILIGLSDDNDTLAAQMQYTIAGDTSYAEEDSLIGAYIFLRAADSNSVPSGGAIPLYQSAPLLGFAPVNRADGGADNLLGSFSFDGEPVCSLQIRDDLADSIYMARASRDTDSYKTFAFSIMDYADTLLKLDNPYIVVNRLRKDCCKDSSWVESDTIRGTTRYSPFEDAAAAPMRAREPYSSQLTQRTAVFKVNVGKILDSLSRIGLSGSNSELLNAVITVRYHADSVALRAKRSARNVGNFKALISDTLLTRDIDIMSDSGAHLLRNQFKRVGLSNLTKPYNTIEFKTVFRNVISKYHKFHTGDSAYIYVYLRPDTDYSTIWWCKPAITYPPNIPSVTVETVFTPHGLRRGNNINK